MKNIIVILSATLCLVGFSSFTTKPNESTVTVTVEQGDYCPKGYICEATNCRAIGHGEAAGTTLTGISVYKNSKGEVIAYVPRHGHLRCFWSNNNWCFNANGGEYHIVGYNRR